MQADEIDANTEIELTSQQSRKANKYEGQVIPETPQPSSEADEIVAEFDVGPQPLGKGDNSNSQDGSDEDDLWGPDPYRDAGEFSDSDDSYIESNKDKRNEDNLGGRRRSRRRRGSTSKLSEAEDEGQEALASAEEEEEEGGGGAADGESSSAVLRSSRATTNHQLLLPTGHAKDLRLAMDRPSALPSGYSRVTEPGLVRLLTGTVKQIKFTPKKGKLFESGACDIGLLYAYYDVDLREQIDRSVWQVLALVIPALRPYTFRNKIPEAVITAVKALPCFALTSAATRIKFPCYCRKHKRIEVLSLSWSQWAYISLMRPNLKEWEKLLKMEGLTRSHLCHNNPCDHPFHSLGETQRVNSSRKPCSTFVKSLIETGTPVAQALQEGKARCQHTPECWPQGSIPCLTKEQFCNMIVRQFQNAMREHGRCELCKLDFPVHIGRVAGLGRRYQPTYFANGRLDAASAAEPRNVVLWMLQAARPREWFNALHAHDTSTHLEIEGDPIWMGMQALKGPWWSSLAEVKDNMVETFGVGVKQYPKRYLKQVALAVDPDGIEDWGNWAGWREAYIEDSDEGEASESVSYSAQEGL